MISLNTSYQNAGPEMIYSRLRLILATDEELREEGIDREVCNFFMKELRSMITSKDMTQVLLETAKMMLPLLKEPKDGRRTLD